MFKYDLLSPDLHKERADIWEIFKDSPDLFNDLHCQIAGHGCINSADKLFDLFYWTLHISRGSDYIGAYEEGKLIAFAYLTHIEPIDRYSYRDEWEASFHAGVHPDYRSPKYTTELMQVATRYFIAKHELMYLFSWPKADNTLANRILLRNGFEFIDIMKGYRKHEGVPQDYNLFIFRG